MHMTQAYSIGIDFGTTKTLVAYNGAEGKPQIAHLGRERDSVPTTVFAGEDGTWEFGEDADDHAFEQDAAERYAEHFKLLLGSSRPALMVFSEKGPQSYTARELTARFLRALRERCEQEVFNGHRITSAVITHPVQFTPAQVEDLRLAAEEAGFARLQLMSEPQAAGLAFCRLSPEHTFEGTALVVDWGGGTLDLALASRTGQQVSVHKQYSGGSVNIGGKDFDDKLWNHAADALMERGCKLRQDSKAARRRQTKQVRHLKERLSRAEQARLVLSGAGGAYPALTYTRAKLEALLAPIVQQGIDSALQLQTQIRESSLRPTQVLLIGGSSAIPLLSRRLEEKMGLPCRRWQYSHEAVALGAALAALPPAPAPELSPQQVAAIAAAVQVTQDELQLPAEQLDKVRAWAAQGINLNGIQKNLAAEKRAPMPESEGLSSPQRSYCMQAQEYLLAINGQEYAPKKGLELLQRGAEAGEPCCLLELAACYESAIIAPYHPAKAREYKLQAASMGSRVAVARLLESGMDARGNPLSKEQKEKLRPGIIAALSVPNAVDDDDQRYIAISDLLLQDMQEFEQALHYCRLIQDKGLREHHLECIRTLQAYFAWQNCSGSDAEQCKLAHDVVQRIQAHLAHPCYETAKLAYFLSIATANMEDASDLMSYALRVGQEHGNVECCIWVAAYQLIHEQLSQAEAELLLEQVHTLARFGTLGRADDDGSYLHGVELRLAPPDIGSVMRIYPEEVVQEALSQSPEAIRDLVQIIEPEIQITNTTGSAMRDLDLSMRCEDGVFTYRIPQLKAKETFTLIPGMGDLESWPPLSSDASLELCHRDQYCFLRVTEEYRTLMQPAPLCPLLVTWTVSFFGGRKLCVRTTDDSPIKCLIRKLRNNATANIDVKPKEIQEIGWLEFSDSTGVELDEQLVFCVDGFYPMLGVVCGESHITPGWKKAAGVLGGAVLFALGGS